MTQSVMDLWKKLQKVEWDSYKNDPYGVFSTDDYRPAVRLGEAILKSGNGLFLDIGCGCLSLPSYMKLNSKIKWIGIDPFFGDVKRKFPFAQALGEYLPFKEQIFDGILYASTIDHLIDPIKSLKYSYKILKSQGRLYIWYTNRKKDQRYIAWKKDRNSGIATLYNRCHQWAFTHESIRGLIKRTNFNTIGEIIDLKGAEEYLIIATKRELE